MNTKLGGCLIGYALQKKNGEYRKVIFDNPIHNTITKSCLNNLLMFNGNNDQPTGNYWTNHLSLFVTSQSSSERYGVFNSAALGNGTGATAVTDTDLHNRIGNYTFTKKTGSGWCGRTIDSNNGMIKIRISHIHTIEQDFEIKEIGWFNRIYPAGLYSLSSRVALDTPVSVESGDTFYSIYEVTISFQDVEKFFDFGGTGKNGYLVNSAARDGMTSAYFPTIDENGYGHCYSQSNRSMCYTFFRPTYLFGKPLGSSSSYTLNYPISYPVYNTDKTKAFWEWYGNYINGNINTNQGAITLDELKNYTIDSFYRDVVVNVDVSFFLNNPIWGLIIGGVFYRFGNFDEQDNFTPEQVTFTNGFKFTYRESWSTDLLTPAA